MSEMGGGKIRDGGAGTLLRALPSGADTPSLPEIHAMEEPPVTRVFVAGPDVLARAGLRSLLGEAPYVAVAGEGDLGAQGASALSVAGADVLVLHGISEDWEESPLGRAAVASVPGLRAIVVGACPAPGSEVVRGHLPDTASPSLLAAAITVAAVDYTLVRGAPAAGVAGEDGREGRPWRHDVPDDLSERERDILALISRGLSNAEIAAELTVSLNTVKTHVRNVLSKLRLENRVQAVVYAFRTGRANTG
ncbi:DNA-binding response regulator [Nocardiopsis terrae]|uniref:DNA-binding NarL/FixJ family response regulator n=1 Tax=Nocardiopsis terrae TaxID=372655 RepID=A0ABR9HD47_9ACTN|nr:response regulator transcription factor [Nocardiopsis terrae]MBE1456924.1 DNA-binding NarL/FixJ family response regulator [Nocardiopsis terrae]GHC74368.1 DNA-binding response regulator [Nocardiopsis terrae]